MRSLSVCDFVAFPGNLEFDFLLLTDLLLYPNMLDSMFDDVKRMDKRQFLYQVFLSLITGEIVCGLLNLFAFTLLLGSNYILNVSSGVIFWHDSILCIDDLERSNGGNWF